ncbi:hypothetical protein ACIRJO_31720 [Streptomyces sp. NPDC102394]|uniref:hypothetical protein n=1 Tax=Streptomyces sp. NPDC102394 TaxID=3366167 RepID=UPI003813B827
MALAGVLVGVLIGVTGFRGDRAASPGATVTQTVPATPGEKAPAPSPSSATRGALGFGEDWRFTSSDPAKAFEAGVTVLGYREDFTSVGNASEEAGEPGYVWAYADLRLCVTKGSFTDSTTSWTLYYSDGSRVQRSGTTYGDLPKPEYPFEVTVTAGKCARGKLVFAVPDGKRPQSVLFAREGVAEPKEWAVPKG